MAGLGQSRLAIDFGTSNTAAAVMVGGKPYVIPLEPGERTLPTAVFLDFATRRTLFGNNAVAALIAGRDGRFMRALKSILGTPLARETRQIMNERITLLDLIARFLAQVKAQAEAHCGQRFDQVLSGRPVRFHSKDEARNAQALVDLRECYLAAGFAAVDFLPEPEAAALASGALDAGDTTGLIVDIGGGTSDFTVFTVAKGKVGIVASHGIRLGGTDFDRAISLQTVMPLLGRGTQLRNAMGPGTTTAPVAIFAELARWEMIPFLYTAATRRAVAGMAKVAVDARAFGRFVAVLEDELGHDIAFAVERGKIAANKGVGARIVLDPVEAGLSVPLEAEAVQSALSPYRAELRVATLETLERAGMGPEAVAKVVFVGGSSLMGMVAEVMREVFPAAALEYSDAFTAVVDGLAIAAELQG